MCWIEVGVRAYQYDTGLEMALLAADDAGLRTFVRRMHQSKPGKGEPMVVIEVAAVR